MSITTSVTASRAEPITEAIVTAVADAAGVDPLELPPLWEVIDSEALEEVFEPTAAGGRRRGGRVEFEYCGYDVTVAYGESATVAIDPQDG